MGLRTPSMGYALPQWCLRRRHAQRDMVFRGARRSGTTFLSLASEHHHPRFVAREATMKIALVAQNATPMHPRAGSGPDGDDIGLAELTRKIAGKGNQVTVYAQKSEPGLPGHAELCDGVRVEHI